MFIAKDIDRHYVFLGTEFEQCRQNVSQQDLRCPICDKRVIYNESATYPFAYFSHEDGTPDCTQSDSASEGHRLPVEIVIKAIHNRVREVSGKPVEIDVEKWIGLSPSFRIADVRVSSPVRITAEIFHQDYYLGLSRRLPTMFRHDYSTYLIFTTNGRHDIEKVERDLQRITPLQIGRFDPNEMELSLGDLFGSDQIKFDRSTRDELPRYLD